MVPRELEPRMNSLAPKLVANYLMILVLILPIGLTSSASIDLDVGADYEVLVDAEDKTMPDVLLNDKREAEDAESHQETSRRKSVSHLPQQLHHHQQEVRCYCNRPHCVSQGYMCRGRGCFTELPRDASKDLAPFSRPEHSAYSGCLEKSFKERPCPPGFLCCEQDLCNHVDSPAMRSRLNKTLQMLMGEHWNYLQESGYQPTGQAVPTTDNWFKAATIAVPICGFFVLLVLASLAIRLLQPIPSHDDKLHGLRMPEIAPPLLPQNSKIPIV